MELTKEYLHDLFEYRDGNLYRKVCRNYRHPTGIIAGYINASTGYRLIGIDGKYYPVHRLIWLMHYGALPQMLDHVDGDKSNNRIENLRPATSVENNTNTGRRKDNTSGIKGVHWHKPNNKWQVRVQINGKRISFGLYDDLELAELVAIEAHNKHHGEFARHS